MSPDLDHHPRRRSFAEEFEEVLPTEEPRRSDTERRNEALILLLTLRHGVLKVDARLTWSDEALRALRSADKEKNHTRRSRRSFAPSRRGFPGAFPSGCSGYG